MNRIAMTVFTIVSSSALCLSAAARADAPRYGRDGFTAGVGLGGGNLECKGEGCDGFVGAVSLDLRVGGMLDPTLAGLFDMWWMVHDEERDTISQLIMTGGLRFWPVTHFWLQGGLGIAQSRFEYRGVFVDIVDRTEWVPAFQVAIGVEPIATDEFGLDIALRYGTGFYYDGDTRIHNGALTVGASFY
jgi:hypothetical protein